MDKGLLQRATSSDDSPTPGYMYGEIAKMTLTSVDACRQIEEYLVKRLGNKNANVKLKALLIIKVRRDPCASVTARPRNASTECRSLISRLASATARSCKGSCRF